MSYAVEVVNAPLNARLSTKYTTCLFQPRANLESIVAVHGLNGGEKSSWTDPGTNALWLSELPKRFPSACVMTFSYAPGISSRDVISAERIRAIALNLLKAISDIRKESKSSTERSISGSSEHPNIRPLVFIGHDLGGTIIKQALSIANFENPYLPIAANTCLLVLFGTPHRARSFSGINGWKALTTKIAAISLHQPPESLSGCIHQSAQALMDLSSDFLPFSGTISILNFHEGLSDTEIVGEWPATLDIPTEHTYSFSGDHSSLCKPPLGDARIDTVCERITRTIIKAPKFDKPKIDCLKTFSTLNPEIYIPAIPDPESVYSGWLFSHPIYESWLRHTTPAILSVHGELGGSALSSLALKNMRVSTFSPNKAIIFFFCNESDECRNCIRAVLSSLIRQLLVQQPSLLRYALSHYNRTKGCSEWSVQQLLVLFRTILCSREHIQIICVIDALDACGSGYLNFYKELIDIITTDKTESPLKFIITTRLPPETPTPAEFCFHLNLDTADVRKEIQNDVKHVLDIGVIDLIRRRPEFSGLEESITAKVSHGEDSTFLDVSLVLNELNFLDVPSTRFSVREKLESLVFGSQEAYERQLRSIPPHWQPWASEVLSWLLCAARPFTADELAIALAIKAYNKSLNGIEDLISQDMVGDLQKVLGSFISILNYEVHLIHSSAKEFLLSQAAGDSWYDFNLEQTHEHISRTCLTYLSMEEFNDADISCLPELPRHRSLSQPEWSFLAYAARNWPIHYRLVKNRDSSLHTTVLDFISREARLKFWPELYQSLAMPRTPATWGSVMQIACELGFEEIVIERFKASTTDELRAEAVEWAARGGHQHLARWLLETGAAPEVAIKNPRALNIAALNGHLSVVTLLLESGYNVEATDDNGEGPLTLAAENGHAIVVEKLLAEGNGPKIEISKSLALLRAAENGYYTVIKELLRNHAGMQAFGAEKWLPLHVASQSGYAAAVKELLDGGADPQPKRPKLTPLHLAAQAGNVEIVKQILAFGRDVDPLDSTQSTPLHHAAHHGHPSVVDLLLAAGADRIRVEDVNGNTPLHLAAANGDPSIAVLLLRSEPDDNNEDSEDSEDNEDNEVDVDEVNWDGNTALHLASYAGNVSFAKKLVLADANVDATNSAGDTPLHLAAYRGHIEMVVFLRSCGADGWIENLDGYDPDDLAYQSGYYNLLQPLLSYYREGRLKPSELPLLHRAVQGGYLEIVRQQLATPSDINAKDAQFLTALHLGAIKGKMKEVKLLLQAGADVNAKTGGGFTPLHYAVDFEQELLTKLLLDNGANPMRTCKLGQTPLHRACRNGNLGIIKLLLHAGADPQIETNAGLTPLDMTPFRRRENVAKALKQEAGSNANYYDVMNANIQDSKGRTKLFYACVDRLEIAVKSLLEAGADPEIKDIDGRAPLDLALEPTIRTLLFQKIKSKINQDAITPLDGAPACSRETFTDIYCDKCRQNEDAVYYRMLPFLLFFAPGLANFYPDQIVAPALKTTMTCAGNVMIKGSAA